jgi:hypothetical protein
MQSPNYTRKHPFNLPSRAGVRRPRVLGFVADVVVEEETCLSPFTLHCMFGDVADRRDLDERESAEEGKTDQFNE